MHLPLTLTTLRIVLSIVVCVLLLTDAVPFRLTIAAVCFLIGAATDFADGRLARKLEQVTPLGAFLDPLADKLLFYLTFTYLAAVGLYPLWILLLLLIRDLVTDGFRSFAIGQGIPMPANLPSKWKSTFQMASLALLLGLIATTELQAGTLWGADIFARFIQSTLFGQAFAVVFWLMVASAAVGIVGTVQYAVEYSPSLFLKKPSNG